MCKRWTVLNVWTVSLWTGYCYCSFWFHSVSDLNMSCEFWFRFRQKIAVQVWYSIWVRCNMLIKIPQKYVIYFMYKGHLHSILDAPCNVSKNYDKRYTCLKIAWPVVSDSGELLLLLDVIRVISNCRRLLNWTLHITKQAPPSLWTSKKHFTSLTMPYTKYSPQSTWGSQN